MTERVDPKRDYWDWVKFCQEEIAIGICTPMEMARLRVIIDRLADENARLREACTAAIAYDDAIRLCGDDPSKMSSFCTASGDDLDTLYFDWMLKARKALEPQP